MNRFRHLSLGLFGAALLGCAGGNAENPSGSLTDPFVGLGTSDEKAQFNDALVAETDDEQAYTDPFASSVAALSSKDAVTSSASDCSVYFMRVRWGQFVVDKDAAAVTDWSGTLSVNAGTLVLLKTIRFDTADSVADRTDPKVISFTSRTRPHFDGLRVKYVHCASDDAGLGAGEAPTLTFNSPQVPFSKSYTLEDLKLLNETDEVGNANGDRFQIQSVLKSDLCQGTISGYWFTAIDDFGRIKGTVVASDGVKLGHIRGFFSPADANGERQWVAKFIGLLGRFRAILRGTAKDGAFSGDILNRLKEDKGDVSGSYVDGDTQRIGTFSGIYTLDCAEAAAVE